MVTELPLLFFKKTCLILYNGGVRERKECCLEMFLTPDCQQKTTQSNLTQLEARSARYSNPAKFSRFTLKRSFYFSPLEGLKWKNLIVYGDTSNAFLN